MDKKLHKYAASGFEQVLEAAPYKKQLYGHLPPISLTIQAKRARHPGHCKKRKNELISDVLR